MALLFPVGSAQKAGLEAVAREDHFDVVIIGSGIAGSIIANELAREGRRVLVVEAAAGNEESLGSYSAFLDRFYSAASKDNQSPFAVNPNALMPRGGECRKLQPGETNGASYMVQSGPYVSDTVYSRLTGGTTVHWEAKTPRMLEEDFDTRQRYGQGLDWPIKFEEMEEDYQRAENEIGVSANVRDQTYLRQKFPAHYEFPMKGLPLSYLDQMVGAGIDGTGVELDGDKYRLKVRPFPQGRNSIPNAAYRFEGKTGYVPVGAVMSHEVQLGERCQGNTNCVPICPVQAKYHAGKTLAKALQTGNVELRVKSVASEVLIDRDSGRVSAIKVKVYKSANSPEFDVRTVRGTVFVLAASAIENARLMLASGLPGRSQLIGRNLMDHAYLLSWALMPNVCGTMRGTSCTGGIIDLRDGPFRRHQAAFSVDIHNDGWGWATGSPTSDVLELVDDHNKFGRELRQAVIGRVSRQLLLAFMLEVPPVESNRVTVDPRYTDAIGNMRPVISIAIPEYTLRGAAYARIFAKTLFARLGAVDHTRYDPLDYGYVTYQGEGYAIRGGNHLAGTHIMGTDPRASVVDSDQRSWDYENLYLAGAGSMPTIGTANVTLTLAALCYRSARAILKQLRSVPATGSSETDVRRSM
jgi:choline dehydrogenase-like flavoprotein